MRSAGTSTTADIGSDTPPVAGDVSKVAAEGEPLLDGTVLRQILLQGGVAINRSGKVAFGGRATTDTVPAVFTQDGVVVKEGDTLPDGTIVNDLSPVGELAISVGPSADSGGVPWRNGNRRYRYRRGVHPGRAGRLGRAGPCLTARLCAISNLRAKWRSTTSARSRSMEKARS